MIHAYAIEPQVVVELAKIRLAGKYIIDNFGIGNPALMAEFPKLKKWRKQFRQLSDTLNDIEKQRLTIIFEVLTEKIIQRNGYKYNGDISWLENAEKENTRHPFQAIIASANPRDNCHVLTGNSIEDWSSRKWCCKRGAIVGRNAEELADIVSPMLKNSIEIYFIDPYFRPNLEERIKPMQFFLERCAQGAINPDTKKIQVHVSADYDGAPDNDFFINECKKKIPSILPQGVSIVFRRLSQISGGEKLHNRYILTDIGGVLLGYGVAQGGEGERDDISLLSRDQYLYRWKQYAVDPPSFKIECQFTIDK